jgi:allantoinase
MKEKFDLIIKNGKIVLEDRCIRGNVYIKDGKIEKIDSKDLPAEANEIIDAEGKYILPGGVDCHSHIWEPTAYDYREDFYTGSCNAASGGITTMIEMPLSVPPVTDSSSFENRLRYAKKSILDYALWGAFIEESLDNIEELHKLGCVGFKGFISKASPEYPSANDYILLRGMQEIGKCGSLAGLHAENSIIIDGYEKEFKKRGLNSGKYHELARPEINEIESIQKALLFSEETGCRLHICHLSIHRAIGIIEEAKKRGVKVTVETCPHYLTLTIDDLEAKGGFAKCNPPLRNRENLEKLWDLLKNGKIDCLGTDHTIYTDEDRLKHGDDIWSMPPGIGASDLFLPLMIDEGFNKRNMDMVQIANLTATSAAKIFGIYPQKGAIRVNADADLIIVDTDEEWTYEGKKSFSKSKCINGPFEGRKIKSSVIRTILRGKTIFVNGKIVVENGGQLVKPVIK